jgi:KUP system potassium uptake protein
LLLVGVLLLVIAFKLVALASAYGIAVTGTMVVTTARLHVVWKMGLAALGGAAADFAFLVVDLAFLAANLIKVKDGGWVPLALGGCAMIVMWTWMRGTRLLAEKTHRDSIPLRELIAMLEKSKPTRVPGTAVFLTSDPSVAPAALLHNLKHNKVLHERVLVICVRTEDRPRVGRTSASKSRSFRPTSTARRPLWLYGESAFRPRSPPCARPGSNTTS